MIEIQTRFLGVLDCPDESVITFPSGIPPFPDQQFVVISKEGSPFLFLQSVSTPELCFIALPVHAVDAAYSLAIDANEAEMLDIAEASRTEDLTRLTILTIPANGCMTANLAAPVVINARKRIGLQLIRSDNAYSHVHPLDPAEAKGCQCSS